MGPITRLLLSFLLAITLPFHAAFGIAMVQSMVLGSAERVQGSDAQHSMHGMHADVRGVHGHADHHPAQATTHEHHPGGADSSPEQPQGSHCGTCSVCCTSVGLTGTALVVPRPAAFDERIVLAERPLTSVSPQRLERPPLFL